MDITINPYDELQSFKSALDNSAGVAITDVHGTITYANDMFSMYSKYSKKELIGQNHRILKSGFHDKLFYKNMWNTISSGKIWHGIIKNKTKDGTFVWLKTMIMPIFNKEKKIVQYIAIRSNITPQIELSEKLIKQERLSSIGLLASRMAHDIRNPLSVIRMSLENLQIKYNSDKSQQKSFDRVDRSIDRIAHQIEDVLDFVKDLDIKPKSIQLSEIISISLDSLKIPKNIELILPKNDFILFCDKIQCAVVIKNLIFNSIQSIEDRGIIEITSENNDDTVIIQVKDSGEGISKEDMGKIFEPLFTTKQQGTGLGLASVKSIIESHGGIISVTSPPTIFTITLPKINS